MAAAHAPYRDARFRLPLISLMPGDCEAGVGDTGFVTLLGSCVSACLYDTVKGIGGMNHFLLPEGGDIDPTHAGFAKAARYGDHAMELLVNKVLALGARREHLVAKAFGGAAVLSGVSSLVGSRNAEFVRDYLEIEGVPLIASDLCGVHPRQIYFFPSTGDVFVRQLRRADAHLIQQERDYAKSLQAEEVAGNIYLF